MSTSTPLHSRFTSVAACAESRVADLPAAALVATLADFARWPEFVPGVTQMTAPTALEPGAAFTWTNAGSRIASTLATVTPGIELSWEGRAMWLRADHRNRIEQRDGGVALVSEETMTGFGVGVLMPAAKLAASLAEFVEAVIAEAERRAAPAR